MREVSEVSIIIKDLEEQAAAPGSLLNTRGDSSKAELKEILNNLTACLEELQELVKRYSSLSSTRKRTWDRIGFANQNVQELRSRLVFHISTLTIYLDGLAGGSLARLEVESHETKNTLARIEKMLQSLVVEVQTEVREPSVLSADESDPWNVWQELRTELENEGLPARVVGEYRADIKAYLSGLVASAGIDELRLSDNRSIADTLDLEDDDPENMENLSLPDSPEIPGEGGGNSLQQIEHQLILRDLNAYIFEYLLKVKAFGCARAVVQTRELDISSTSSALIADKELLRLLATSPEAIGVTSPNEPVQSFLEEWFTLFIEIFQDRRHTKSSQNPGLGD